MRTERTERTGELRTERTGELREMREHLEQIGRDNVKKREHGEQQNRENNKNIGKYYIWFLLDFRDCLHRSLPTKYISSEL